MPSQLDDKQRVPGGDGDHLIDEVRAWSGQAAGDQQPPDILSHHSGQQHLLGGRCRLENVSHGRPLAGVRRIRRIYTANEQMTATKRAEYLRQSGQERRVVHAIQAIEDEDGRLPGADGA
jgi:hypothetical protein